MMRRVSSFGFWLRPSKTLECLVGLHNKRRARLGETENRAKCSLRTDENLAGLKFETHNDEAA